MKTLVIAAPAKVKLSEMPEPVPLADEALIAVKACGICGSEMDGYREGKAGTCTGHEVAGVVEKPGNSGRLKKGDRVVLNVVGGCGSCEPCASGHENHCQDIWTKGRSVRPQGHAEKVVYVERNCLKIPDDLSFESAIMVGGCGIGVAWHGLKRLGIQPDEWIPVFGVGPIGLAAVSIVKQLGAKPIALDLSEFRLNLAVQCGAVEKINSRQTEAVEKALKAFKIRRGILCTGHHGAANTALRCLTPLGTLLILGGLNAWPMNSWQMIGVGDKTIMGSWHYHRAEWDEILALNQKKLPLDTMITHRYPFNAANEAYAMFAGGNSGKVVLIVS
ncbi:MAG: alcohol dehydrogenase catalytic domain-containing protein [Verrucomicrobiae bacterium]|nr:alcohol dehydrogenase catalytic domain-containing protein [Verrucomicrobiae bacterium]